ncbi:hypothetical protein LTR10_013595 [Elasticomyces elasticus]|uniref:PLD phosphodiesterase domain-containing protein n=1 Tax=Exophiala sideris TaxID=1016849 RepID=A0ABR0JQB6_9EURO|nr:hypothetical protein LTR10_013595 [Elasticomyces elasticus]KAK5039734.1 hypothetical protein LTS07_000229 [Exophiala sideris]KAK5041286.1 hypothetical protein LTR13_002761 [Exophiala sideris]KAK5068112.1 hypothetical protein LTR69_000230 [Exophiala sideris]KAK5187413.1 hypothetical protein LTR44_000229 [Eurotiomycetes sp. CCFEE 6388]
MIPKNVLELCQSGVSVSAELAKDPNLSPHEAAKKLFHYDIEDEKVSKKVTLGEETDADLDQALACGNWGTSKPTRLFLRIFHDVLCTLEKNPLVGVCSPSLLGSNGVCPLTIFAPIPDICRHMSNVIARAEEEVYLATNFWMHSEPTMLITNAIRELNRKAGVLNKKIVVKIIYDRGSAKQFIHNHIVVEPKTYADPNGAIRLPHPDEIPHLDMEVINFHQPIFGTFHCKYVIADRKIAIIQSNNIQDNDNLEMMTQWEGAIVDSFYDMALSSWHNALHPPLPLLNRPAAGQPTPTFHSDSHATLFDQSGKLREVYHSTETMPDGHDNLRELAAHASQTDLPMHTSKDPHYDPDIKSEVLRAAAAMNPRHGERRIDAITRLLNTTIQPDTKGSAPDIQPADSMTPFIPIPQHDPVPVAMVCREPWGKPGKASLHTPQNEAFASALRHAERTAFIQTPDLNAEDLIPEIIKACRRGVHVEYWYCLGYNDAGELLPGQNGHNEMIAHGFFKELEEQYHQNLDIHAYVAKDQIHPIHNKFKKRSCHIKVMIVDEHIGIQGNGNQDTQSWYHSQEINIMCDSRLIVGKWMEGLRQNQNTHVYGKVEKEGPDSGCWKDPQTGKQAEASIGVDPGKFAWAKGFIGAVQRVRGAGGF